MATKSVELILSYSKITTFQNCRRKYYYSYVKGYESRILNINFVVGNFVHLGLRKLYSKEKNFLEETMKFFDVEKKRLRKEMALSVENEQSLNEQEVIIHGILRAYAEKYKKFISETKLIGSEEEIDLRHTTKKGSKIMGRLDNLLERKDGLYIHEVKTAKYVNEDYIRNIKNNLQISLYRYMYNQDPKYKKKIKGFIYDVIMKPSIRQKQKESKTEFMERLYQYYLNPQNPMTFYMEIMDQALITPAKALNVIDQVSRSIKDCETENDFYHNFNHCFIRSKCEFYSICMHGENQETMNMIKIRQGHPKAK